VETRCSFYHLCVLEIAFIANDDSGSGSDSRSVEVAFLPFCNVIYLYISDGYGKVHIKSDTSCDFLVNCWSRVCPQSSLMLGLSDLKDELKINSASRKSDRNRKAIFLNYIR